MMKSKRGAAAFDSSILIYFSEAHPIFGPAAKKVLEPVAKEKRLGVMSVVGVTEILSLGKKKKGDWDEFERLWHWLLGLTNLSIIDVNPEVAVEAARLRVRYGFKTPDALHLACAIATGAEEFYTNDKTLLKCKEIKVIILKG